MISTSTAVPPVRRKAGRKNTAVQPSATYTGTYSQRGAPTQSTRNATPASAPAQTTQSSTRAGPGSSSRTANGV